MASNELAVNYYQKSIYDMISGVVETFVLVAMEIVWSNVLMADRKTREESRVFTDPIGI